MTPAADKHCHRPRTSNDRYAALQARIRNATNGPQEFEFKGTFNYPISSVVGSPLFATGEVRIIPNSPPVTSWGTSMIPNWKSRAELRTMITPWPDGSETYIIRYGIGF